MNDLHICRGTNLHYVAVVREHGRRRWTPVSPMKYRSRERCAVELAKAMATKSYKRGAVLFCADWYDPTPVLEMVIP